MPFLESGSANLGEFIDKHRSQTGWWYFFDKYIVSLLKAWYGEHATQANEFGFGWLPRVTGDHSEFGYWLDMADGKMDGLFVMGQNPAVGAPNGRLERKALAKLKWLVVRDMVETETASFWRNSPEVERGEIRPKELATEVFLFPAAGQAEKSGTFTNTQRLIQFHNKAIDPPGDARSESWFVYHLGRRLKAKAAADIRPRNAGLNALTWHYATHGDDAEPNPEEILQEINGYTVGDRKLVDGFKKLEADGSTACGCWIYSGIFPEPGKNKANLREPHNYLGHGWGYAWRALVRAKETGLVGQNETRVDRHRRPRLESQEDAGLSARARCQGRRRNCRGQTVHYASGRSRMDLRYQWAEGWASAHALRAAGITVPERALSEI
jgi:formate dehydrogenase major subunit